MDIEQQIRVKAFELWEAEGCPDGRADHHWSQAQAEISAQADVSQVSVPKTTKVVRSTSKTVKRT